MKYLTFDQIKAQLRLDDEQAALEEDLLTTYGEAAEDAVLNTIQRTYTELCDQHGSIPSSIAVATLLVVDDLYNHRGTTSNMDLKENPAFRLLLSDYLKLTKYDDEYGRHCNL